VDLVGPHVVETAIGEEVVKELLTIKGSKTITSLVNLGVVEGAGLTELVDAVLEEVLVSLLVVVAESLLEVGVLGKVVLEVKNKRASTALLDTILMPVVVELASITVEGVLEIRILVVVELGIEDKVLKTASHGSDRDGSKAHSGDQTLRITLVLEVPEELPGRKRGEPWVACLVDLRVIDRTGGTELVDAVLEEVLVSLLVVVAESLLEVGIGAKVVLEVKDARASTALLDTILMPVVVKLASIAVEGILEIRVLGVVESSVKNDILHVAHGTLRRNTSQNHLHHFDIRVFNKT
jgi:hypothetical protein